MKAFANIKSRYAEYKALDSADKAKAWKEGRTGQKIQRSTGKNRGITELE